MTDMPTARGDHAAVTLNGNPAIGVLNDRIFVIGGRTDGPGFPDTSKVEPYDPIKDECSPDSDIPTARSYLSASVVNNRIYAVGGSLGWPIDATSIIEEYTPENWRQISVSPQGRLWRVWGGIK